MDHDETQVGLVPDHFVLDRDLAPPPTKGHSPHFAARVYCGQTVAHLSYCSALVKIKNVVENKNVCYLMPRCHVAYV